MRLTWALLALLERASALDAYVAVALKKDCAQPQVGCEGYYRAFGVKTSPANSSFEPLSTVTGISVAAIGAQATSAGAVVNAKVDVAGFRFKTPADLSDDNKGLSFYFGYLGVTGTWDGSTKTSSAAGALAEVVSMLSSINVYYDNDKVAGFKWDITQSDPQKRYDIFNSAQGELLGYDTLDVQGTIDLKTLTWSPIAHTVVNCSSVPELAAGGVSAGCEIHSLTTTGSLPAGPAVITFTSRIASQPLKINGALHGPDRAKFDVSVKYPWASVTGLYAADKAKILLVGFSAGKSGTFAAAVKRTDDNSDSLVFTTAGSNIMSYYAYTPSATVDGTSNTVTTQVVTGQQIKDFSCVGAPCGLITTKVAVSLQLTVAWLELLGWKSSLTFHSLGDKAKPLDIFWDPEVGSTTTAGTNSNSASFAAPSLVFLLALLMH